MRSWTEKRTAAANTIEHRAGMNPKEPKKKENRPPRHGGGPPQSPALKNGKRLGPLIQNPLYVCLANSEPDRDIGGIR